MLSGGASAVEQRAYEVQAARSSAFEEVISSSGTVESSDQIAVPAPGAPLESREIRHYRVRVTTNEGASPWSDGLTVEAGLLHPADWLGKAISLPEDPGSSRASAAPILRKEFNLDPPRSAPACMSRPWGSITSSSMALRSPTLCWLRVGRPIGSACLSTPMT